MNYSPASTAYMRTIRKLMSKTDKPKENTSTGLLARSMPRVAREATKIENEADDRVLEIVRQIREKRENLRNG